MCGGPTPVSMPRPGDRAPTGCSRPCPNSSVNSTNPGRSPTVTVRCSTPNIATPTSGSGGAVGCTTGCCPSSSANGSRWARRSGPGSDCAERPDVRRPDRARCSCRRNRRSSPVSRTGGSTSSGSSASAPKRCGPSRPRADHLDRARRTRRSGRGPTGPVDDPRHRGVDDRDGPRSVPRRPRCGRRRRLLDPPRGVLGARR